MYKIKTFIVQIAILLIDIDFERQSWSLPVDSVERQMLAVGSDPDSSMTMLLTTDDQGSY